MKNENRVLIRMKARELSAEEVESVNGGVQTFIITFGPNGRDGDG